jgi:signal transduction histidine kinase
VSPIRSTLFWRLAVGLAAVSLLAVAGAGAFLYLRFGAIEGIFREGTIRSFSQALIADLAAHGSVSGTLRREIARANGQFVILDANGLILDGSGPDALVPPGDGDTPFVIGATADQFARYGMSRRGSRPGLDDVVVQVAFPESHILFDSVLEEFIVDVAWMWLPFLLMVLAMNIAVAKIALRPLGEAVREAEAIGPASVSVRLTERRMPQDVLALVRAVNGALERLQHGYVAMEDFVGDVAHELRTPLSVMKAQIALSGASAAATVAEDFSRMERLIAQLLDRVRLGGLRFEATDQVELVGLAQDVASFLAPVIVARKRSIEVVSEAPRLAVAGSRDHLFRALRNLIENAVEHTPAGTTVTVEVSAPGTISVTDHGPGFGADRLDPARRATAPVRSDRRDGVGLGLAIVERTLLAHGGRLDLYNRPQGGGCAAMVLPGTALSVRHEMTSVSNGLSRTAVSEA